MGLKIFIIDLIFFSKKVDSGMLWGSDTQTGVCVPLGGDLVECRGYLEKFFHSSVNLSFSQNGHVVTCDFHLQATTPVQ